MNGPGGWLVAEGGHLLAEGGHFVVLSVVACCHTNWLAADGWLWQ